MEVCSMSLNDDELAVEWAPGYEHIVDRLGVLEWAKAICIEALKISNTEEKVEDDER